MDGFRRLALLTRKEWADLRHQRTFVIIGALTPFLLFLVFYLIWSADITMPLEVVNKASGKGEAFVRAMQTIRTPDGTPYIEVQSRDTAVLRSRTPSEYVAALEIPSGFERARDGIREYHAIVHYGAVNQNSVKNYINRLHEAESRFLSDNLLGFRPIRLEQIARYPRDIPTRQSMAVSLMAYAFLLSGSIFGGVLITREYEGKTVKLIRVAPVSRVLLFASKGIVALLLTLGAGAVYVVVATGLLTGAWPVAAGTFLSTALTMAVVGVALGMVAGMLLQSSVPIFLVAIVVNLGMWIIGGGFGNLKLYSEAQQYAAQFLPFTHGMKLFWYSYFGGQPAPSLSSITGIAIMLLATPLVLAYTVKRFLERGQ